MKGDHRILGGSAFVMVVLAEAEEKLERFYELKSKGYDLDTVEKKVCEVFGVEPDEIYSKSREKTRAEARGYIVTGRLWNWDTHWQIWQDFLV